MIYRIKPFRSIKKKRTSRYNCQYNFWRKEVYKRDDHTCQVCGKKNIRCIAHHIMGYKKYPLLRYEVMNGITLCYSCHKKFHDEFGKSNFPNIVRIYNLKNKEKYIG